MDEERVMIIRLLLEIEDQEALKKIKAYTQNELLKNQD